MIREFTEPDPTSETLFEAPQKNHIPARFNIRTLNPQELLPLAVKIAIPAILGIILIVFGLTTTGSYYVPSSRFGGFLATLWYGWQLGTLLAILGGILIYDAIKRTGYL